MPNRIIKESICASENVDQLTAFQETFFIRLMVNCDDFGRMDARARIIAARLYPLKDIKPAQVEDALTALASADLIIRYTVDGKPYLQMKTWERHQQIRAKKSKYPSPDEGICNQMISNDIKCPRNPIQSNTESNPNPNMNVNKKEPLKRFTPPTVEEVKAYCMERGNHVDPERFVDFYTAKGWKVGNQPMRDWKAAVRTWERNRTDGQAAVPAQDYHQRDYTGAQEDALARMMALDV